MVSAQGLSGRGDHRRLLLLPLQFADRRRRSPDARRAPGRVPRRAGRQLHRPARDGAVSAAAALRRRLPRRAAERARRSDARRAHPRASRPGRTFSPKVLYVYEKQLEEADIIVINKSDLLERRAARRARARRLRARFPQARDRRRSARAPARTSTTGSAGCRAPLDVATGDGRRLRRLRRRRSAARLAERDVPRCRRATPFDGNQFLRRLADDVQRRLAACGIEIAHFKMTLSPDTGNDLAVLNLVRTDGRAEVVAPARRRR